MVRESVARKIALVQSYLPNKCKLQMCGGYRSIELQKIVYDEIYNNVKKENSSLNKDQIKAETDKKVSPIEIVPPHTTGGAIDICIIKPDGNQLDMGTNLGDFSKKTYTDSSEIPQIARKNREFLIEIMTKAGFINLPTEWWHWSYGDRYWAASLHKKYAIYNSI